MDSMGGRLAPGGTELGVVLRLLFCCRIADAPPPFFPALDWLDAGGILNFFDIPRASHDISSYDCGVWCLEESTSVGTGNFAVGELLATHVTPNRESRRPILVCLRGPTGRERLFGSENHICALTKPLYRNFEFQTLLSRSRDRNDMSDSLTQRFIFLFFSILWTMYLEKSQPIENRYPASCDGWLDD